MRMEEEDETGHEKYTDSGGAGNDIADADDRPQQQAALSPPPSPSARCRLALGLLAVDDVQQHSDGSLGRNGGTEEASTCHLE